MKLLLKRNDYSGCQLWRFDCLALADLVMSVCSIAGTPSPRCAISWNTAQSSLITDNVYKLSLAHFPWNIMFDKTVRELFNARRHGHVKSWRAELVVTALFLTFEIQTILFVSISYNLLTSKRCGRVKTAISSVTISIRNIDRLRLHKIKSCLIELMSWRIHTVHLSDQGDINGTLWMILNGCEHLYKLHRWLRADSFFSF